MTPLQFDAFARFLKERSGIAIGEDKRYLVEARLGPIARQRGLASLGDLLDAVALRHDLSLEQAVVEAMTTNETFFFRDGTPFTLFSDVVLPKIMATPGRDKRLRVWSAACSSGQEPYSLAMLLAERAAALRDWKVEIVATDLSTEIVERAKAGLFSQFEIQRGLPIQMLVKHFVKDGDGWRIARSIRDMVQFRPLNLLRDFSALGRFDVVFCRNVLIYFDEPTKADVLRRIARQTADGGFLMFGSAETTTGVSAAFVPHASRGGLHVKADEPVRPALSVVGSTWR